MFTQPGSATRYWLYDWLERFEVDTDARLDAVLNEESSIALALEMAEEANERDVEVEEAAVGAVVAGRGLDLSGMLTCNGFSCLEAEVDQLFSSVGYYFDEVIVEGLGPGHFLALAQDDVTEARMLVRQHLATHAQILIYLNRIGALPYVNFREKPFAYCDDHFREHASELGLPSALDEELAREVRHLLVNRGTIEARHVRDYVAYKFTSPMEDGITVFWRKVGDPPVTLQEAAESAFRKHCLAAIGDFALANDLSAPLAATANRILDFAREDVRPLREDDVALSLDLPTMSGLGAAELIKLREEDRDQFVTFRRSLTDAIRDQIRRAGEDSPSRVGQKVVREFVEPALADIDRTLRAASRNFSRKSAQNVGVSAVMTAIGLLGGWPLLIGGGVAALSGLAVHANQLSESKKEVELSDVYFLWNAAKKHGVHA